jgi:hypothetical protein
LLARAINEDFVSEALDIHFPCSHFDLP